MTLKLPCLPQKKGFQIVFTMLAISTDEFFIFLSITCLAPKVCREEDEGVGFDYDSLPDPTSPENLDKVKGRGIFLIKNLADKTKFKEGGRVVDMLFKL